VELRNELLPPQVSKARRQEIRRRIEEIVAALDGGRDAEPLISRFNELTGRRYRSDLFHEYWEAIGIEDFVTEASRPEPGKVDGISRAELIEVVRRAMAEPDTPDSDYYMELFEANVAMPHASSLIHYPPDYQAGRDDLSSYSPTPEAIVDRALSYRSISP
jgi:hypothetical protein